MKHMVAGFMFSDDGQSVVLIEKQKPERFKGWWNGVGGHVEPFDRSARAAMSREFHEEAGVKFGRWEYFARLQWVNAEKETVGCVDFFRAFSSASVAQAQSMTDEVIRVWEVEAILRHPALWPNVKWLLQMARHEKDGHGMPYLITEDGANVHA